MSKSRIALTLPLALLAQSAFAASPPAQEPESDPPATEAGLAEIKKRGDAIRDENAGLQGHIAELERKNAELSNRRAEQDAQLAEVLERLAKLEAARDD